MTLQILEVLTVGLPFCAFKIVTGIRFEQHWLTALGCVDLVINIVNLLSLLFLRKRLLDACLLSFLTHQLKRPTREKKWQWQDLGNSIDVLLSFSLVALMVGGGYLGSLPITYLSVWNLAVVLNVFGAGLGRLTGSIRNLL